MTKDPYLYDNSETLINFFKEHNDKKLREIEADYTSFRLRQLYENPIKGCFDFFHLCEVHKFIFQDLYHWAGETRVINIEKEEPALGGISVEYTDFKNIKKETIEILKIFSEIKWKDFTIEEKALNFSKNTAALWKVHPFREGNTRTIITFVCDFADKHGFKINRSLLEKNSIYLRTSLVAANAVFKDIGDKSQIQYLYKIILDAIK